MGQQGTAITDLRLAGKATIGGQTIDVVSEHEYLERGTTVLVTEVEGVRVVVVAVPETKSEAGSPAKPETDTE
jgi:membrane-bound serine protease (ClpP class)